MIKIKDNIALKELKKYGLKPRYDFDEDTGKTWIDEIYKLRDNTSSNYSIRFINKYNGLILCYIEECSFDLLYDLIKDGIVEKVE